MMRSFLIALTLCLSAGAASAQTADPAPPAPPPVSAQAQLQAELERYRAAYEQEGAKARDLQADRDRWKAAADQASSTATACKARNDQLLKVAYEILDAYKKADLDDVIGKKEPFFGLKRVQLENLAQGYEDKVYGARCDVRPDAPASAPAAPGG
ncbi:MAG: hypothetical protein ACXW3D_07805 [Caulobacteraceae bacterium]